MISTIAGSSNFDISAIQLATLFLLIGEGELTIKRIAELLGRSVSATSRMLDQLVARGLISRTEDVRDQRTKTRLAERRWSGFCTCNRKEARGGTDSRYGLHLT